MQFRPLFLALIVFHSGLTFADNWPHLLGPNQDLHSTESGLDLDFGAEGPTKLWEVERGKGHAGPVVVDGRLVFIHQIEEREEVVCLDAATGERLWAHDYPVDVQHSFGIVDAPRCSPTVAEKAGLVFTLGNDGDLIAFKLATGEIKWELRLPNVFGEAPFFFGYGGSPLVVEDQLIIQPGSDDVAVAALSLETGDTIWTTDSIWHGSYASPIVMEVNGNPRILAFLGGMTDPPAGGLVSIRPEDGSIEASYPWRSERFASVNGASPVQCGPNRVFITEDYGEGGVMLRFDGAGQLHATWKLAEFGCQFQTPIFHQGVLYGFGGNGGLMMAVSADTGTPLWSETFYQTTLPWEGREIPISLGRAHAVYVDGAFLVQSENGTLLRLSLEPSGYRLIAGARLFYAPETWSPPVVANGRLYLVQNELGARLICYDVGAGAGSPES